MPRRRPLVAVSLTLLTLGLYGLYWFYSTSREMVDASGSSSRPALWLVGLFVPVVNALVLWKHSRLFGQVTGNSALLVFLLWLAFFPAAQYLVQRELNAAAGDPQNPVPP